jgi:hypothetical protein
MRAAPPDRQSGLRRPRGPPAAVARRIAGHDRRLRHIGIAYQAASISPARAEAAQLHLHIGAAEEVEHAVGAPAHEIPVRYMQLPGDPDGSA